MSLVTFSSTSKAGFPDLVAWAEWCYCSSGELCFRTFRITSTTGVQQGDSLGLLFSLAILELMNKLGHIDGVLVELWYLDDGTFIGTRDAVSTYLELLISRCSKFGLHINFDKCRPKVPTFST